MKDMRAVRFNEKVKRLSTVVGNGGLALLAAGISRWFLQVPICRPLSGF